MGAAKPVLKSNVNETDLIARAVCKDEAAIREIIKNNNSHLYRIARSVLHDNGEAEDVLQESYVKAFAALAKFRGDSSLKTWLSRIVLNECLQRLRNPQTDKSRMDELRPEAQIIQFPYSTDQPLDPERNMAQRELVNLVEKAVDRLPGEFRLVLVARTMEGLSIEDTANLLGLKPETVKTRLFRARKLLKEALAEHIEPLLNDTFPFMGLRCEHMADVVVARMCRK